MGILILSVSAPVADRCDAECEERVVEYRVAGEKVVRLVRAHLSKASYAARHGLSSKETATARAVEREAEMIDQAAGVMVFPKDFLG